MKKSELLKLIEQLDDNASVDEVLSQTDFAKSVLKGGLTLDAFKEKLTEALERKSNDINSFVWKGRKVEVNGKFVQSEKYLMDCSEHELRGFYAHCDSMLHNESEKDPGRYVLIDITKDQRMRCNAELLLRWLEEKNALSRFSFLEALRGFLTITITFMNKITAVLRGIWQFASFLFWPQKNKRQEL